MAVGSELVVLVVDDEWQDAAVVADLFPGARHCSLSEANAQLDNAEVVLAGPRVPVDGLDTQLKLLDLPLVRVATGSVDELRADFVYRGPIDDELRDFVGVVGERRRLEREVARLSKELRHGLRLEALGRIAGGVAHDFNNLLTTIGCFAGFIEESGEPDAVEDALEISNAAQRGTELTRRLTALSREREPRREAVDVSTLVDDLQRLLAKSAGLKVRVSFELRAGLSPVRADRSDLEQSLLHLVLRARDGFTDGGQILVSTWQRGRHVGLELRDDGPGLSAEEREEIFADAPAVNREQLGLRAVREIVEQSGGVLEIDAKLGVGTTYRLIFDALAEQPAVALPDAQVVHIDGSNRHVLVFDQDERVCAAAQRALERCDFLVTCVQTHQALSRGLHAAEFGAVDFLIADAGTLDPERREALRRALPGAGLILTGDSGMSIDEHHWAVLRKPFGANGLLSALRSAEAIRDRVAESRPARVLIVDDDELTARSIERVLSGLCEPEHVFGDRNTLLARLEAGDFDLVLCDVLMPGINGMQLFEWVRARDPALAARFVFLTAAAEFDLIRTFADSIPNPVYAKPMDRSGFEDLLAARGLL